MPNNKPQMKPKFFASSSEFRKWLEKNHDKAQELWIGLYKKGSGKPSITWPEAVDQLLCFGWIDGVRKRLNENSYTNRATPRRPRSNWSAINIKRVQELTKMGLMHPAGLHRRLRAGANHRAAETQEKLVLTRRKPLTQDLVRQARTGAAEGARGLPSWRSRPPRSEQTKSTDIGLSLVVCIIEVDSEE